jgi:hypothetical protein
MFTVFFPFERPKTIYIPRRNSIFLNKHTGKILVPRMETFFHQKKANSVPRGSCLLVPRGNNSLFYQPLDGLLLMFHDRVQVQERKLLERSIIDNLAQHGANGLFVGW